MSLSHRIRRSNNSTSTNSFKNTMMYQNMYEYCCKTHNIIMYSYKYDRNNNRIQFRAAMIDRFDNNMTRCTATIYENFKTLYIQKPT